MEFRARYIMIGSFTVGVIAAVFLFVFWLSNAGGLKDPSTYQVRFQNPVTGLQAGSGVLFNGVRVGEVTALRLDPENPRRLNAIIQVEAATPIRVDTKIGVEFQGLTGGANILLAGASSDAPKLTASEGAIPVLVAGVGVGQSLTQSAGEVLKHIDGILVENSAPLKNMIGNLNKFSEVLVNNSGKIDGILSGLERMTGGKSKDSIPLYDLTPATNFTKVETEPKWHLVISEPTVLLGLNTDKILMQPKPGEILTIKNGKWTDNLPNLFQTKLVQSFENAGYLKSISKPAAGADSTHRLTIDIRKFQLSTFGKSKAVASFIAKIQDNDGKILATKQFDTEVDAKSSNASAASQALGQAFSKTVKDLIGWTAGAIVTAPAETSAG